MVKVDALQAHLKSLGSGGTMLPLYIFSGDEPLLMMEAIDQLRLVAKKLGFTEREVMLQERGFDWSALMNAGQTMSLFGDKRWVDLRIPTGKPGRDGADALKQFAAQMIAHSTSGKILCARNSNYYNLHVLKRIYYKQNYSEKKLDEIG